MNCRTLLLLALVAAGCGGTGSSNSGTTGGDPFETGASRAIKVTYIRYNLEPRAKRWEPEYRIMLSDGWRQKNGQSPREPQFTKIFRHPFLAESIPDEVLVVLAREMVRAGLNDLRDTTIDRINTEELKKIERLSTQDPNVIERVKVLRIINIETEDFKKTVTFYDNDDRLMGPPSRDSLSFKFSLVEREVIKVAVQYTVQIRIEANPAIPK